jgi:hypothetical protein
VSRDGGYNSDRRKEIKKKMSENQKTEFSPRRGGDAPLANFDADQHDNRWFSPDQLVQLTPIPAGC